jgi:hypothetical protein
MSAQLSPSSLPSRDKSDRELILDELKRYVNRLDTAETAAIDGSELGV